MTKWISVKDRLPHSYQKILFMIKYKDSEFILAGMFNGETEKFMTNVINANGNFYYNDPDNKFNYCNCGRILYESIVTHWMPLPEPPENEE